MVGRTIGVGRVKGILRGSFERHVVINQVGLISIDMPEVDVHDALRHSRVRQGMIEVTGLPIENITVRKFAAFLKDHIQVIIRGVGGIV